MDEPGKEVSEREKWEAEKGFRERELQLKAQEIEISRRESTSSQWRNPLVLALLAAAVAAAGNAVVALVNGNLQRDLEDERSEQARILEVIKVGSPDKAAENLDFLLKSGLIRNVDQVNSLSKFLKDRRPGTGPSLPSADDNTPSYVDSTAYQEKAQAAANNIFALLNEKKYSDIWDHQTSEWLKRRAKKDFFIADLSIGRSRLGNLQNSSFNKFECAGYDPYSGYIGIFCAVTFVNEYQAGTFIESVMLVKDADGMPRLSGFLSVPEKGFLSVPEKGFLSVPEKRAP